jgi:YidC/Oxa1 family membrane protein insertase
MLDVICYPVSAILWFWHKVFAFVLQSPDSGICWTLAVVFLVFTLRLILIRPFIKQVRTQRQMQKLQPKIKELQRKYKGDRQRLTTEMQQLQRDHGVNPLLGCLPVLLQIPVFFALFHVLRSFNPNSLFSATDVQSFLDAKLFGAPLSAAITMPVEHIEAFGDVSRLAIAAVAVPLMVIAAVATHFTARANLARSATTLSTPQTTMMNNLALWVLPIGAVVGGPFLPIAIGIYWLANNGWTLAQQHWVLRRLDAEETAALAVKASPSGPPPSARPAPGQGRRGKR